MKAGFSADLLAALFLLFCLAVAAYEVPTTLMTLMNVVTCGMV